MMKENDKVVRLDPTKAIVVCKNDRLYAQCNNGDVYLIDPSSTKFNDFNWVYNIKAQAKSKPFTIKISANIEYTDRNREMYSVVRPNDEILGGIQNGMFVLKKLVKQPKTKSR